MPLFPCSRPCIEVYQFVSVVMLLAVCGLHMLDGILNYQLVERGASFIKQTKTLSKYTMHALTTDNGAVKPALVFHPRGGPHTGPVTVEVWDIPNEHIGSLLQIIPPPLGLGTVHLQDGTTVYGFIAEGWATDTTATTIMGIQSEDITRFGGWREWQKQLSKE